jgi:LysR family transcriptional regulator, transcription activator of glutamate synthase operon
MDMRQLEYFREVGKVSHITRAAERVGITQPTLSRAIERLELEVGVPLIERSGRSIRLTPYGTAFWKHVDRALESIEAGRREIADMAGEECGTVALGFLWALGERLVPELVRVFAGQHPHVRFRFVQNNGFELERLLIAGDINFAMLAGPIAENRLEWQAVTVQHLVLIVPPGHRFAERRTIRLAEAAREAFVLFPPGHALRAFTDDLCRRADFTPEMGYEGDQSSSIRLLVAAGLGIALVPDTGATDALPALRIEDLPAAREIGIAWVRERYLSLTECAFREHVLGSARTILS